MPLFICMACGTQYPDSVQAPAQCVICEEERQYVPPRGQTRTTLDTLRQGHMNAWREYEPGITGIGSNPASGGDKPPPRSVRRIDNCWLVTGTSSSASVGGASYTANM